MRRYALPLAGVAAVLALSSVSGGRAAETSAAQAGCPVSTLDPGYVRRVDRALRATEDVWGNALLTAPGGPTHAGARRYLKPLLLARAAKGAALTESRVHYVPFSGPAAEQGAGSMALHVADGSQILAQRAAGTSLTIGVGERGQERYGSCLARLGAPDLADGYLPILETRYVDADGVSYRQESFAARIPQTRSLVSFVRLTATTPASSRATLRFTVSEPGLVRSGDALVGDGGTYLAFAPGAVVEGSSVRYAVPPQSTRTIYLAWLNAPDAVARIPLDEAAYESAKWSVVRYWQGRLAQGAAIEVPERRVEDAYRSLLVQNLSLGWRYSVGNPYQQFSFPEGVDVAQALSAHGFSPAARATLVRSFSTPLARYPNWKMGQKLVGSALYYRLTRDDGYVEQVTPSLRAYVATLGAQIRRSPRGILDRERFSSDIEDRVYGLHAQAIVWQGLRSMASVWAGTGYGSLGAEARALAARLEAGLRQAVRESQRRLPDGSLFVPMRLLDGERPYGSVTESRAGAYWNLVAPYAFASGLLAPESVQTKGAVRYLLLHGARLLGLVRAGAYSLYGQEPISPASGVNPVYGLNAARLMADVDRPDQLVLSLYGQLAAGMTAGTFVSGEAVSVAPLGREYHRSTYLPPNSASNASFLETLRLMLVHESRSGQLEPRGLDLAFATPRAWLAPGKRIAVRSAPTSFGPVSFSLTARETTISGSVDVPRWAPVPRLRLRLRLPAGTRISSVALNGRPYGRFDRATGTIDLTGRTGRLALVVRVARA